MPLLSEGVGSGGRGRPQADMEGLTRGVQDVSPSIINTNIVCKKVNLNVTEL